MQLRLREQSSAPRPWTYPLAVALHVAALEGAVQRVSVDLLQQGAAAAEEHVLRTPALVS